MFNDLTTSTLIAAMRGGVARQQAISQNIANADTPGYKKLAVSFEGALAEAVENDRDAVARSRGTAPATSGAAWWDRPAGLATPGARSLETAGVGASATVVDTTTVRVDGSNVDPDDEMALLAANQLAYNTATGLLATRFGQFRTVIQGQ